MELGSVTIYQKHPVPHRCGRDRRQEGPSLDARINLSAPLSGRSPTSSRKVPAEHRVISLQSILLLFLILKCCVDSQRIGQTCKCPIASQCRSMGLNTGPLSPRCRGFSLLRLQFQMCACVFLCTHMYFYDVCMCISVYLHVFYVNTCMCSVSV